jgi:outer membrane protein TolC
MKFLTFCCVYLTLFCAVSLAQEIGREEIRMLVREVLAANPEIAARGSAMTMFERRIPQAGALPDPELSVMFMEFPGLRVNEAMRTNVELMQMIPFPTKLGLRKDMARIQSEHAHHDYLEKAVSVVAELKSAVAMLWFARTSLQLNRENQDIAHQILKSAETLHAVGKASQSEVLKSTVELSKLRTEESGIHQEIASAESMLRAILNRPRDARIGEIALTTTATKLPTLDELLQAATTSRPLLRHDSLSVVESGLSLDLMKQEYLPDFKVAIEYIRFPALQETRWSIGAGITLPFAPWSLAKASARVEEAEAARLMRISMYTASRNMVRGGIEDGYAKVLSYQAQWKNFQESILPLTDQSLKALLTEYQTGRTSFFMVLDTYRMLHEMKRDAAMALMKYHQSLAGLERELGVYDLAAVSELLKENE